MAIDLLSLVSMKNLHLKIYLQGSLEKSMNLETFKKETLQQILKLTDFAFHSSVAPMRFKSGGIKIK